jgi:hypothetical protein
MGNKNSTTLSKGNLSNTRWHFPGIMPSPRALWGRKFSGSFDELGASSSKLSPRGNVFTSGGSVFLSGRSVFASGGSVFTSVTLPPEESFDELGGSFLKLGGSFRPPDVGGRIFFVIIR